MLGPSIVAAVIALVALVLWPKYGLHALWLRYREMLHKERLEHTLKHTHHCEVTGDAATLESLAGALGTSRDQVVRVLEELEQAELVEVAGRRVVLTDAGRREALRVIRTHRLWEKYLAERSGLDETRWHDEADRREHLISHAEAEELAEMLGHPRFDPHGAPIPTPSGELPPVRGILLSEMKPGQIGRVVHVEDEPKALHEQLVVQGLNLGALVRIAQRSGPSIQVEVGGESQGVALVAAANVRVEPLEKTTPAQSAVQRLSRIGPKQKARVVGLLPSCRGIQRRRLLDLGLVPGTIVEPELRSAWGDPIAYRVRGALVALREHQANQVEIEPIEDGQSASAGD